MDKKVTGIVAYVGILCGVFGLFNNWLAMFMPLIIWVIAYVAGDKEGAKFHLNQSLVLIIIGLVGSIIDFIPLLVLIVNLVIFVFTVICGIMGLIFAIKEENKELPLIGAIKILK